MQEEEEGEVRTADIPIIPNPRAASKEELQRIWAEAVKDIPPKPQKQPDAA